MALGAGIAAAYCKPSTWGRTMIINPVAIC
jgi:hypothetical protein